MPPDPYRWDMAYARCYAVPEVAMDKRHVYLLNDILRSWPFKNALEIGSFNGASSTAFVEAINAGSEMTATFCDVCPTHSLMDVVKNCRVPDRAKITRSPSTVVLDAVIQDSAQPYDFVLVDGRHDAESVAQELMRLIVRKPLCVMAHDTNATEAGFPACEGAKLLRDTFDSLGWWCLEDREERDGELTHRGIFMATPSKELWLAGNDAFLRWCR